MAWERVWGPTEFVVVNGETGVVFAKPAASAGLTGGIYRWDGTPFGWTALGGGTMVACVTAGWAPHTDLYGIDGQGVVHRYEQGAGSWLAIGGPSNGTAARIYGGPDQLLATAAQGSPDVFQWDAFTSTWVKIGGPGKKFAVGKSSDIEFRLQVYGQSPDDAPAPGKGIHQWRGAWYKEGGPAGDIFVSQSQLFATNPTSGDLLMKSPTGWKRIGDPGHQFATDHRGHIYRTVTGWCGRLPLDWHTQPVGEDR